LSEQHTTNASIGFRMFDRDTKLFNGNMSNVNDNLFYIGNVDMFDAMCQR
jgi:hypothetical protein